MSKKTYIIGEIGINHNGCIENVKRLIDIASVSGFDAVKFQKRDPDSCVPENQKSKMKETPWGTMSYLDYKKRMELSEEQYDEINKYCKYKKIDWSASPWDLPSAEFLLKYNLDWVKISSASVTDLELIRYCAISYPRIILSTGMSTQGQVITALDNILRYKPAKDITVLHCNSSYPAPVDCLNLNNIITMKNSPKYAGMNIGYSGHEYGLITTIATVAMGATCIERHITIDKGMWGSDQSCSLEPHAMFKLVRGVRELESALGSYTKTVTDDEIEKSKSIRLIN